GRPETKRNALYRKFRIKLRDNQAVREAFMAEIDPKISEVGLQVPAWKPNWSSEEATSRTLAQTR
ncbi:MAG: hypothetical protein KGR26_07545, partial [Cyanobacteria bacterium REEB65]|nr:hypothetical protein [Cyanobacteria bacterium REEB65]